MQATYIYHSKDKKFGLPKLKKYPMPDTKHVKSAIKFFNYVDKSNEQELANSILARIKEYGMDISKINVGDENRFKKYLVENNELYHHGILGQKWGVRRYQNSDGSLTDAGRKRYYDKTGLLNKKGNKRNKKLAADYNSFKDSLNESVRNDSSFEKHERRYKDLQKRSSAQYQKDKENFIKGKDFKKARDYYEFKDQSANRWSKSKEGSEQAQLENQMRKSLDDAAKQKPNYSKKFIQLHRNNLNVYSKYANLPIKSLYKEYDEISYGTQAVNDIMASIKYD